MYEARVQAYLGDGLYAEFDGYQIRLYADTYDRTHEVFLDSQVTQSFVEFAKKVRLIRDENRSLAKI